MEGERCDFCQEGRLCLRQVREYYRTGKGIIVIDKVPAYVCGRCGERYYTAEVAKRMRHLARNKSQITDSISFPLVNFRRAKVLA